MKNILFVLAGLTLIMSCVSFALMRDDKARARRQARRIPEKQLFISAACFGAIGGMLGMQVFRHKTRHWEFRTFFPTMMIIQVAVLAVLALKAFM